MSENLEQSFAEVVRLIQGARSRAYQAVNREVLSLNWQLGEYVSRKIETGTWGKATVQNLSRHIRTAMPGVRGYSAQNLWRMRQFYETYRNDEKLSTLVRELPWTHNTVIISKCKRHEDREFYLRLAQHEGWDKRRLEREIDSALFERHVLSPPKVSPLATQLHPSASEIFRDSYLLDFMDLPHGHSERDLQHGLVHSIRRFLQTLGPDFCFIGEEYRLQVGGKDFFLDLLFYHRGLECLVLFELKIDDFKPEYLGKLEFYLEALDRDIRKPHEKPSVGVLLCKSKDAEVVEYALSRSLSPAVVSQYQTVLPDKVLLQQKLHEFYELATELRDST
jgi:predicted nuclease of restriction endonuclease-like (RecB) superfamily